MEFEGVVYKIMPVTRGTSARGEWQRQDVVFDYNDGGQFSRKISVTFFNKESDVAKLREGETYLVSVNIESREYNGRWYTDIRAWRVQPSSSSRPRRPMHRCRRTSPPRADRSAEAPLPRWTTCRSERSAGKRTTGRVLKELCPSLFVPCRDGRRSLHEGLPAVIAVPLGRRCRRPRRSPSSRRCCSGSRL